MSAPIKPADFLGATELVLSTFARSTSEIDLAILLNQKDRCSVRPAGSGFAVAVMLGSAFWLALGSLAWSLA